jgi:fluoroacetyl-CoA thioesterase
MSRKELAPGSSGTASRVVEESDLASSLSPDHEDSFPRVFATARMVALMEMAAARAMREVLEEGELTAGVSISVTHTAATPLGASVSAAATFLGMAGKFYRFEVVARDEAGEIGRGTHERAVISHRRLLEGAQARRRPSRQ